MSQMNDMVIKIKEMPEEHMIAYGSIVLGVVLILVALILW